MVLTSKILLVVCMYHADVKWLERDKGSFHVYDTQLSTPCSDIIGVQLFLRNRIK